MQAFPSRAALLALCLLPAAASAQFIDFTPQVDMANRILMDQAVNRSVARSRELIFGEQGQDGAAAGKRPAAAAKPVLLKRVAPGSGIAALVATYPEARRPAVAAAYREVWARYPEVVAKLDPKLSSDDLSVSATVFVLGCFMAYENRGDIPDAQAEAVLRQVRGSLAARLKPGTGQPAELYRLHEQLGVLGVSMALAQSQLAASHDPELARQTKEAAARYLSAFLGLDASRVRLSEQGLRAAD